MKFGDVVLTPSVKVLFSNEIVRGSSTCKAEKGYSLVMVYLGTVKEGEDADPVRRLKALGWTPPADLPAAAEPHADPKDHQNPMQR